jgi:hypothetical protein
MHRHKNVTRDIWRAVVVAGAMLGTGCSAPSKQASPEEPPVATQPALPAPTETGAESAEGTSGAAVGGGPGETKAAAMAAEQEIKKPPPPPDAGVPDASPPPDARPRKKDGKPRGRGFLLA